MDKPEIVCDTSILLYLGRIGHVHLLPILFERIAVPETVMLELDVGRLQRPDTINPRSLEWVLPVKITSSEINTLPLNRLGRGERTVIAYAHAYKSYVAGLDDLQARLFAQELGVKVIGTLGILIKAKLAGVMPSIREILQNLQREGFHLSSELQKEALRLTGEEKT